MPGGVFYAGLAWKTAELQLELARLRREIKEAHDAKDWAKMAAAAGDIRKAVAEMQTVVGSDQAASYDTILANVQKACDTAQGWINTTGFSLEFREFWQNQLRILTEFKTALEAEGRP